MNYRDPSGNNAFTDWLKSIWDRITGNDIPEFTFIEGEPIPPTSTTAPNTTPNVPSIPIENGELKGGIAAIFDGKWEGFENENFNINPGQEGNNTYIENTTQDAESKGDNDQCDISHAGYTESTKEFIKKLEGDPYLKPRINDDGSITLGYGYDFTEEDDPDTFSKYLERNEDGNIVVKASMTLEDAEETIKWEADKKGMTSGLEQFINGEGKGNKEKALIINQNQYDALFSYFYSKFLNYRKKDFRV